MNPDGCTNTNPTPLARIAASPAACHAPVVRGRRVMLEAMARLHPIGEPSAGRTRSSVRREKESADRRPSCINGIFRLPEQQRPTLKVCDSNPPGNGAAMANEETRSWTRQVVRIRGPGEQWRF